MQVELTIREVLVHSLNLTLGNDELEEMRAAGIDPTNRKAFEVWALDNIPSDHADILDQIGDDTVQSVPDRDIESVSIVTTTSEESPA